MTTAVFLRDGNGSTFSVPAEQPGAGLFTPHSAPEVNGAVVSTGNPMPVSAAQSGTWQVAQSGTWQVVQSGSWSISATLQLGSTPVGSGNPLPVSAAQSGTWQASLLLGGAAVAGGNPLPVVVAQALPAGTNAIGQVAAVQGAQTSRSLTTVAATSTQLMPANTARKQFWFQAPQTAGIWINRLGGTAGPSLTDCTYWPPGSYYETGAAVSTSAITYYCATAGLAIAAGEM